MNASCLSERRSRPGAGGRDNISPTVVRAIAERMKEVRDLGVEVAVVIGGGNIWRGLSAADRGMDRTTADYMGMLATVINALALRSTWSKSELRPAFKPRLK